MVRSDRRIASAISNLARMGQTISITRNSRETEKGWKRGSQEICCYNQSLRCPNLDYSRKYLLYCPSPGDRPYFSALSIYNKRDHSSTINRFSLRLGLRSFDVSVFNAMILARYLGTILGTHAERYRHNFEKFYKLFSRSTPLKLISQFTRVMRFVREALLCFLSSCVTLQ